MVAKVYKIQKVFSFTHFNQKITHISACISLYKCKNATVIMHICTIIVALHFIFDFFFSLSTFSLFLFGLTLTSRSLFLHLSPLLSWVSPQLCHRRSPHLLLFTPIAAALTNHRCYLFSLFDGFGILINGFWWFWSMVLMILISGFWWFWLMVLMILISGFGILMGGLMIATALSLFSFFFFYRWWWLGIESRINILLNKCVE